MNVSINDIRSGNTRALARSISLLVNNGENKPPGFTPSSTTPVIGITGPPGAGKSTLTDKLIGEMVNAGQRVAVLCIDPSSPYTKGAILGDRIRMSEWYNHPQVFIRSLASRGSLGGLPANAAAIIALVKEAPYDYVILETVGVGQNETEIASVADVTVVVLVPESGDDIQLMKAGLLEIADIFVVNKCDRPGADLFASDLRQMVHESSNATGKQVIKTIASTKQGAGDLFNAIKSFLKAKIT